MFKSRICLLIAPVPVHCFSITFINSIRCLHLPNVRSKAAIISEKIVFTFFYGKVTKFDLTVNRSRSPKVTIYINFVVLEPPMLHGKFQDHRNSGYVEEDF